MIKPATTRNNRTTTSRNIDRQTRPRTQHNAFARIGATARWALAVAACLWLAWCTAVGPLYWNDSSIANFGALNALFGILAFAIYLFIVVVLVRKAHHQPALGWAADRATGERTPRTLIPRSWRTTWRKRAATFRITKSKTASGIRTIPIHSRILSFVLARMQLPGKTLIADDAGHPYSYARFCSLWDKVMAVCNVLGHTTHDCRHTVATLLDNAGANEAAKKRILGHAGSGVTEAVYTHKNLLQLRKTIQLLK